MIWGYHYFWKHPYIVSVRNVDVFWWHRLSAFRNPYLTPNDVFANQQGRLPSPVMIFSAFFLCCHQCVLKCVFQLCSYKFANKHTFVCGTSWWSLGEYLDRCRLGGWKWLILGCLPQHRVWAIKKPPHLAVWEGWDSTHPHIYIIYLDIQRGAN